jgi:hypothetical protein
VRPHLKKKKKEKKKMARIPPYQQALGTTRNGPWGAKEPYHLLQRGQLYLTYEPGTNDGFF